MVASLFKKWPPWSRTVCKKFQVTVVVKRLKGVKNFEADLKKALIVEVKWKGQKGIGLRRPVKKNLTQTGSLVADNDDNGVVEWNEEFQSFCSFSGYKEDAFHPWEVAFTLLNGLNQESRSNIAALATVTVNLAEFASVAQKGDLEINIPVKLTNIDTESCCMLCLSLHLVEQKFGQEFADAVSLSPNSVGSLSVENDEIYVPKRGLFKSNIFKDYVSLGRTKRTSSEETVDDTSSTKSGHVSYDFSFETDSYDENPEGELEESNELRSTKRSTGDGILLYARCSEALRYAAMVDGKDEAWIHYSYRISDEGCSNVVNPVIGVPRKSSWFSPNQLFQFWRKLSFRYANVRGEPLLKRFSDEEGGDDIDYDRRMFSSSDESICGISDSSTTTVSEFGDDVFVVGSWELKDIASRDGQMKLQAPAFFASIDQRSERAAGESACTALVVVIADWLLSNRNVIPIKCDFDRLIREGSSEWRNLCENETYIERFPDKHFDLETVLEAKVRPLTVIPAKSFIGFFYPEGLEDGEFDFLHGAMSFDSIWEEISHNASESSILGEPLIYIVSWNDHFFVLEFKEDAYYIIDTLGERLYEGCNQAYALKFDKDTKIRKSLTETSTRDDKNAGEKMPKTNSKRTATKATSLESPDRRGTEEIEEVLYSGKDSCKEYIKNFLAAIPIRELLADIKKGLKSSTHLHHQLQIEFHYTETMPVISPAKEAIVDTPTTATGEAAEILYC